MKTHTEPAAHEAERSAETDSRFATAINGGSKADIKGVAEFFRKIDSFFSV
jgi:hypothetical protein